MENITANEVAGLGVGALLLSAALAAPKVDAFIARAQRRELKLCMECGGVTRIPCGRCQARGTLNESVFGSGKPVACPACRGKGNFPCPCCCGNKCSSSSSLVRFGWGWCGVGIWPVKISCLFGFLEASEWSSFLQFVQSSAMVTRRRRFTPRRSPLQGRSDHEVVKFKNVEGRMGDSLIEVANESLECSEL